MSDRTRIEFEATIILDDAEIDAAGGLERAVQNEIGPAGAVVVRVFRIHDYPALVAIDQTRRVDMTADLHRILDEERAAEFAGAHSLLDAFVARLHERLAR